MAYIVRLSLLALVAVLVSGCGTRQVGFFDAVAARPLPRVERLYIDRQGDLYPEAPVASVAVPPPRWDGRLYEWFTVGRKPCGTRPSDADLAALCAIADGPAAGRRERWFAAQEAMMAARGRTIAATAALAPDPEIVFLVHGFNNTMAEAAPNFAQARAQISGLVSPERRANLMFVEIYWDGCWDRFGPPCWPKAQWSGPLAGFALRGLFNALDAELDARGLRSRFRVITHSSGAFVMAAALGNPAGVLPQLAQQKSDEYRRFAQHATDEIPAPDEMRLAMFAPATTGQIFTGNGPSQGLLANNVRVLFSVHPRDEVLTKHKIIRLGCRGFGVTCLGADRADACAVVLNARLQSVGTTAVAYDFDRAQGDYWEKRETKHDFSVYLEQAARDGTSILQDLMAEGDLTRTGAIPCA